MGLADCGGHVRRAELRLQAERRLADTAGAHFLCGAGRATARHTLDPPRVLVVNARSGCASLAHATTRLRRRIPDAAGLNGGITRATTDRVRPGICAAVADHQYLAVSAVDCPARLSRACAAVRGDRLCGIRGDHGAVAAR